jgi:hypothetical protein
MSSNSSVYYKIFIDSLCLVHYLQSILFLKKVVVMKFQVSLFALISVVTSFSEPVWSGKDEEVSSQTFKRKRVIQRNSKEAGAQPLLCSKKAKLSPPAKGTKTPPVQNLNQDYDEQDDVVQALLQLSETPSTPSPDPQTEIIETVVEEGIVPLYDAEIGARGISPISPPTLPLWPRAQQASFSEPKNWFQITFKYVTSVQNNNFYLPGTKASQNLPQVSSIPTPNFPQPPIPYEQATHQCKEMALSKPKKLKNSTASRDSQLSLKEVKQATLARIAKRKPQQAKSTASRMYNLGCKHVREKNLDKAVEAFTTAEWHGHNEAGRRLKELVGSQASQTTTENQEGLPQNKIDFSPNLNLP